MPKEKSRIQQIYDLQCQTADLARTELEDKTSAHNKEFLRLIHYAVSESVSFIEEAFPMLKSKNVPDVRFPRQECSAENTIDYSGEDH